MKHGNMVRLGLLAASLALVTTVSATETPKLWTAGNDYVQLAPGSAINQHPVKVSAEQITVLLGQFYKRGKNNEPVPYFSQDEISRISPRLVPLFAKAKPDQDIEFGTSFRSDSFPFVPRVLNAGRLFIENGRLNLLIGMCARAQDLGYEETFGKFPELDHGSRTKPAKNVGCELLASNDTEQVNNRTDWLRLNINAVLTARAVPVFPSSAPLTFGATASSVQVTAPATVPSEAGSVPTKTLAAPASSASEAEQRLIILKRLHDEGLITDAEYQQKRAEAMKGL
ncbi:MAG: SHOCT domain-containing protein [Gallionella sp.]